MPLRQQPKSPEERKKSAIKAIGRFSGMAFQLLAACLIGVYLGRWLDGYFELSKPIFAVLLTIVFMMAGLFTLLRNLD